LLTDDNKNFAIQETPQDEGGKDEADDDSGDYDDDEFEN